jgi:hypothetical protein
VALPGNIRLDFGNMVFPLEVSGVMVQSENGQWKFSKMQFIYGWNTNYVIFARIAAYGTLIFLIALLALVGIVKWIVVYKGSNEKS